MRRKNEPILIGVYVPPAVRAATFEKMSTCVNDFVSVCKTKHEDPIIFLSGDFNRRSPDLMIEGFGHIKVCDTLPTRANHTLDLLATNITPTEVEICPPLHTDTGPESDHSIIAADFLLPKKKKVTWIKYKARKRGSEGDAKFRDLIIREDWAAVMEVTGSTNKTDEMNKILTRMMDAAYPYKTYRVKDNNAPWITPGILKKIEQRNQVYKTDGGKSDRWKAMKEHVNKLIRHRAQRLINLEIPVLVLSLIHI